ncbi:hypothetical protein [Nocardioides aurantiacus]|uniref:hypothetical protein n=1 Tax=Nocardioides aurantiacus TaxID=86796 RepID=UPI00403F7955
MRGRASGLVALVLSAALLGCSATDEPGPRAARPSGATASSAPSSGTPAATVEACAVAGFEPTERTAVRAGTRVAVYALPLDLEAGRRGRVPVTLRRLVDLRPGVRAPDDVRLDPAVLRRVAAALPAGSTGPLADTFATDVRVARAAPRPRRLVVYAATRARPFAWTARVCGPPTTADGSATEVTGTGLVLDRFTTGRLDCARATATGARRTALTRQLVALC